MKEILEHLFQHKTLSRREACDVLTGIATGEHNDYQIASFLTAFIMRNITLEELCGFRDGLLKLCKPVDLSHREVVDLCGTGGDGRNSFNISTLTSFVVAGTGIPVAKHGNYGVSSVSGSSNVLEELGVTFMAEQEGLLRQLDTAGICFIHAPLFHPAMRHVAPVRKQLGVRTFFNMLGPLVNPSRPSSQLAGVFSLELARMYNYLFQEEGIRYAVIHSLDGYDEITLTGDFKLFTPDGEFLLSPSWFGLEAVNAAELDGGSSVAEAAEIFMKVLEGRGSEAQNSVMLANSALAIATCTPGTSIADAMEQARESLFGKAALACFRRLVTC